MNSNFNFSWSKIAILLATLAGIVVLTTGCDVSFVRNNDGVLCAQWTPGDRATNAGLSETDFCLGKRD